MSGAPIFNIFLEEIMFQVIEGGEPAVSINCSFCFFSILFLVFAFSFISFLSLFLTTLRC